MPFPNHPPVTNVAALMPGASVSRQAMVPGGGGTVANPFYANQTTSNTAMVPGGMYLNGA